MALRPLVLRAHFYHPGLTPQHNFRSPVGHFKYMGNPKKEELVRAGERDDPRESAAVHAAYMQGRPGSTGYIGPDPDDLPDPEAMAEELRHHDGPVWRMFVSVREDDARKLGLMDRQLWEQAAREVVPEMAQRMGIPAANLRWAAAMHRKEGHPHLHLLVWEQPPKRDRGVLEEKELSAVRRMWVRELYRPVREPLAKAMAADRQLVEKGARMELTQAVTAWKMATAKRQGEMTAPRLTKPQVEELARRLGEIKDALPGKGRVALAYMPPELKTKVHETVNWLITTVPEYREALERHVTASSEMASHYSDSEQSADQTAENARERVIDKLGQGILRAAVALEHAAKRENILSIATAATKGGRPVNGMPLPQLPPELAERVTTEVQRISHIPIQDRRDAAHELARELLAHPAAAAATRDFRHHIAREALGKALPAKWLEINLPEFPLRLPDRYADLARATIKDAAAREPDNDVNKEWFHQINAIHLAPPDKRREVADRAAAYILKQPEAKADLAKLLKDVPRNSRKTTYQETRAQLARAVDHQARRLAAVWTREKRAQSMDALARHVGRSISWAADYAAFQRANATSKTATALWQGLVQGFLRVAREEELAVERLAREEEAARAKRRQMEAGLMR